MKPPLKIEICNYVTPTDIERLMLYVVQGVLVEMAKCIEFPSYTYTVEMKLSGDKGEDFTVIDIHGNMKEYFIERKITEILTPYIYSLRFIFNRCEDNGTHLRILLQRFDVETRHINHFLKVPIPVKKR